MVWVRVESSPVETSRMIGNTRMPWWTWASPLLALLLLTLVMTDVVTPNAIFATFAGIALIATVFAAVFHAEIIAHKVGEPFGTLVLAVAVTVIEVSLIVFVMLGGGPDKAALARDTVFAVVMIVCNGIVGMCLLSGGVRHHEQGFQVQGASAALAVLAALTTLTLVVPNTTSTAGPFFSTPQLVFAGVISLVLYCAFVFVQTVRHRDYFLPCQRNRGRARAAAVQQNLNRKRWVAAPVSYRRCGPREGTHAHCGGCSCEYRSTQTSRGHCHRDLGIASRKSGSLERRPR
jgi:Ca2+/H+ antiporter